MALALRCGSCRPPTLPYKFQKAVRFACELLCNRRGRPPLRRHTVCHHCAEAVRFIGALGVLKAAPKFAGTLRTNYKD